eukprot:m51a1_g13824 hypothetical protein (728) ;mRNA; r:444748-447062
MTAVVARRKKKHDEFEVLIPAQDEAAEPRRLQKKRGAHDAPRSVAVVGRPIFIEADGSPLTFFIAPSDDTSRLASLVTKHGGKIVEEVESARYAICPDGADVPVLPRKVMGGLVDRSFHSAMLIETAVATRAMPQTKEYVLHSKKKLAQQQQRQHAEATDTDAEEPGAKRRHTLGGKEGKEAAGSQAAKRQRMSSAAAPAHKGDAGDSDVSEPEAKRQRRRPEGEAAAKPAEAKGTDRDAAKPATPSAEAKDKGMPRKPEASSEQRQSKGGAAGKEGDSGADAAPAEAAQGEKQKGPRTPVKPQARGKEGEEGGSSSKIKASPRPSPQPRDAVAKQGSSDRDGAAAAAAVAAQEKEKEKEKRDSGKTAPTSDANARDAAAQKHKTGPDEGEDSDATSAPSSESEREEPRRRRGAAQAAKAGKGRAEREKRGVASSSEETESSDDWEPNARRRQLVIPTEDFTFEIDLREEEKPDKRKRWTVEQDQRLIDWFRSHPEARRNPTGRVFQRIFHENITGHPLISIRNHFNRVLLPRFKELGLVSAKSPAPERQKRHRPRVAAVEAADSPLAPRPTVPAAPGLADSFATAAAERAQVPSPFSPVALAVPLSTSSPPPLEAATEKTPSEQREKQRLVRALRAFATETASKYEIPLEPVVRAIDAANGSMERALALLEEFARTGDVPKGLHLWTEHEDDVMRDGPGNLVYTELVAQHGEDAVFARRKYLVSAF